ncbi:MAG: GTPase domain-containing protein, partial [Phycisphaerales bacterium]|nr:GTPase domain-containing protein [Phycisphaerales bacterium]
MQHGIEQLEQLIEDVIAATGADAPDLLSSDSPVLSLGEGASFYLIGLIGGKDVGKSSLVNALVGLPISAASAAGPGTRGVVAYVHQKTAREIEALLERTVPGRFSIVCHENPALLRQVLLDLPDIDSVWTDHVQTTRRMLRHMLFPIWVQSVEKYADQQPLQLLARVAEGNDPGNFLFVINKIDLVADRDGPDAAAEICADFADRVAHALDLQSAPEVFAVSAVRP